MEDKLCVSRQEDKVWTPQDKKTTNRTKMFENTLTVSSAERQQVLGALDRLHSKLVQKEEWTHCDTVGNLRETLQSPLFNHILTLQHSIRQLRQQLSSMPPDACSDVSFSNNGQLIISTSDSPVLSASSSIVANGSSPPMNQTPPTPDFLQKWILIAARGRHTELVCLTRPLSGGLGFSVVGLNPAGSSSHGVFVKQVQPGGIAHRDGRLQERDQILVINGHPLEPGVDQQQALTLLQQPGETVELVVARDRPPSAPSPITSVNKNLWNHVEEIQLVNDGSGLGFGIVGGKTSGVVVRTLVPNSVADKDGRLRTGDHILRIGATPTTGLTSDQVVRALQRCGSHVTMLIARDPRGQRSAGPPPPPDSAPVSSLSPRPPELPLQPPDHVPQRRVSKTPNLEGYEIHEVPLTKKDGQSLGISIIGYNPLTTQDAVGVFVKHVVPGSAADQSGNIWVYDRLIAMDGISLHGMTNPEVLEVMKRTGQTVVLTVVRKKPRALERSLDKVERESSLRRSLEVKSHSSLTSTMKLEKMHLNTAQLSRVTEAELTAKWDQALGPQYQVLVVKLDPVIEDDAELQKSSKLLPVHTLRLGVELDSFDGHHYISSVAPGGPVDKHGVLRPEDELLEVNNVQLYGKTRREVVSFLKEVPPPFTLVCCRHPTSDLEPESEAESEPELASGPGGGAAGGTQPSMEEMELKLSSMLCLPTALREDREERQQAVTWEEEESQQSQEEDDDDDNDDDDDDDDEEEEEEEDDEGELALWSPDIQMLELQKEKDKGLGFSILDYQDPLDPGRCVMVIRSLVPGGSAERHGGLLPGDQLVSVNQTQLDLLSLAQSVEVLKSIPSGTVRLGIRKPLVEATERIREDDNTMSFSNTQPPVPKGFGDGSILHENLQQEEEEEEEEEPELILDGGLPRYATSSLTSDLLPVEEGKEMAVDEEEMKTTEKREEEKMGSLSRKPPPSWEEWRLTSFSQVGPEESWKQKQEDEQTLERRSLMSEGNQILDFRDSEADSELTLTDTDTESVRMIDMGRRKRRTQGGASLPIRGGHRDLPKREEGEGEETPAFSHWGPPRRVEVWAEEDESLGLSIVGGHHVIKRLRNGEELKGIFIKQVLPKSPAAKTLCLKTGDKILEVSGVDLRAASHEEAVSAIKSAPSPIVFIVQSLCATPRPVSLTAPSYIRHKARSAGSSMQKTTPPLRQPPPYTAPSQSEHELNSDLEQAKGRV